MSTIQFGTDGWRAIIARDYTTDNVARVAAGTARWLLQQSENPSVVIGHDCRFGGPLFVDTTARVLAASGIKVIIGKGIVTTPMVSMGTHRLGADLGIVITASHNPPDYNGFKLKSRHGGPSDPADVAEVEALIPETAAIPGTSLAQFEAQGMVEYADLESLYLQEVKAKFDLASMRSSGIGVAYDPMYGAGFPVFPKILPEAVLLHNEHNPGFHGRAPEPIEKNLPEISELIANTPGIGLGIATDGDADRIGLFDHEGKFVDAHHILLLLIHYLHKYKGLTGKVVVAFSASVKVKKLCEHYGLPIEITKIGFKYISPYMVTEDVLVGGEESGGIAVKGHIPERDGIWDGLTLLEFMAKTGKSLKELIQEVYDIVGPFAYNRNDLHLEESKKQAIIAQAKSGGFTSFGAYRVEKVEDTDGFKYYLGGDTTLMIRPSGTEPLLRVYCEAPDRETVESILAAARETLLT